MFWYIAGTLAVVALQATLIVALVIQRSRRRETEARNAATLRAMPDMIFLQTRAGVYVDYHAPDPTRLLMPPAAFIGRHMRDVLPPGLAARFEQAFATLGSDPVVVEYSLPLEGGEGFFEARLAPCNTDQVLAVVRDITERKRASASLADSQERYARATAAGKVGVWDWNIDTGALYVDPFLKSILGYADDEIQNTFDDWLAHVHPDDAAVVTRRAEEHLAGLRPEFQAEHRVKHRDGSTRWFLARGSAVRHGGRATRITGTTTDITERKTADEALHDAQAELARVSRLTALGEFAASIAHEVRQPLTAIIANTDACLQSLSRSAPDFAMIDEALRSIREAGERADHVIQRNGELFRHHVVRKAALDLNQVIDEIALLAGARLRASGVRLTTMLASDLPDAFADRIEIQQVLLNLIVNAVDAMEGVDPGQRSLTIATAAMTGNVVQVSVTDRGLGLGGVDPLRLFTPGYTTKAAGTGVGLSISRSIITAHDGQLWAENGRLGGATFAFTLPAIAGETPRPSRAN